MNITKYSNSVIPVANAHWKEAVIYFNKIITVQTAYLPKTCGYKNSAVKDVWEIGYETFEQAIKKFGISHSDFVSCSKSNDHELHKKAKKVVKYLDKHAVWPIVIKLRQKGLSAVPIFWSPDSYKIFGDGEEQAIEIRLMNAKIIDARNAKWDQIMELREDKQAAKQIRDFRLFLYENYSDKPSAYISDSIEQKIENYEKACKKHGFILIDTAVSSLLASKSAFGYLCLSTVSYLLGEPITAAAIGSVGASLSVGQMIVKIRSKWLTYKSDIHNPELAFVINARKRLKKK
jgi:hypothetical protein